jgi:hypothetical protein
MMHGQADIKEQMFVQQIFVGISEALKHFSAHNFGRYQFITFCALSMQQRCCQMKRFEKKQHGAGRGEIQAMVDILPHL